MKDLLDCLVDEIDRAIGRPVSEQERELLAAWEGGARQKVLTKTPEPCTTPVRWKLDDERRSLTHRFKIVSGGENGDLKGYLTMGMYPSGRLGEMFFEVAKEGSFVSGVLDALVTTISVSLQFGIPLQMFIKKFKATRFEPNGPVRSSLAGRVLPGGMQQTSSVLDYIARYLEYRFPDGKFDPSDGERDGENSGQTEA